MIAAAQRETFQPSPVFQHIRQIVRQEVFTGGAIANLENAPMGKGHGNDGKPFDIETACYMKPKFAEYDKARREGRRLKLVDLSGVKTMKSFALEVCAAEHVCNGMGDVAIFFGSENAADSTATTRILNFYKGNDQGGGIPRFKKKIATMASRFDEQNGMQRFPDKTLFVLSANLGNCAQKNLAFVGLQDGYVLQRTGMIKEMLPRTTAYEKDCIIYLESQGGEKGYDFDNEYEDTDQRELHTICPHCGQNHVFNWKAFDEELMRRPESFTARPPLNIPSLDHAAWIAHHSPLLAGKVAGFQRGDDSVIKRADGSYIEAAIIRETHFQCFFCGEKWIDDGVNGKTRIFLDQKSNYIAANPNALPGNIGFNTPQWISRRLSWGKIMLEKLKAQAKIKEYAQFNDLKVWWQKVAARTWDHQNFQTRATIISAGTYDPLKYLEMFGKDEAGASLFHSVNMAVDCQEDADHKARTEKSITGWFWYIVRAYDKFGNSKQLARGYCKSWEAWRAVQAFWGVPNDRVIIDSIQWKEQVQNKAVEFRKIVQRKRPHPFYKTMEDMVTWKLLDASPGKQNFKGHRDGVIRPWSPESEVWGNMIDESGKVRRIKLARILFNKTPIMQQVDSLYSGAPGLPKFEFLSRNQLKCPDASGNELVPDTLTLSMEVDGRNGKPTMLAYENQMSAQIYNKETNKYDELRPDDHYYWCEQALLVRVGQDGLLGQSAVFASEEKT